MDIFKGIEIIFTRNIADLKRISENKERIEKLLSVFTFSCKDLEACTGIPYSDAEAFIDSFTLPKDGNNSSFKSLGDYNSVYEYPIIKKGTDEYVMLQYSGLAEAVYDTPFYWMTKDSKYFQTASFNRGNFTEDYCYQRLKAVFDKHTHRNVKLFRSNQRNELGEIDVLVVFGDYVIILQAKSKRLTLESRRGNDGSLHDDFRKAVQKAVDQAFLCANLLQDPSITLKSGGQIIQLECPPRVIFPVSVVSDHYPGLSFQVLQFLRAEPTETILAPFVTDIFTIDIFAEFLSSPLKFFSFLEARSNLQGRAFLNHEINALGYHLSHNLWIPHDMDVLFCDDLHISIDVALSVRREGAPGSSTPEGILTWFTDTPFERIISSLEDEPTPVAIHMGLFLKRLPKNEVEKLNNQIVQIISLFNEERKPHGLTLFLPSLSTGLAIHCNNRGSIRGREFLHKHCEVRKYQLKADRWFGLWLRPDESIRLTIEIDNPWESDEEMEDLISQLNLTNIPEEMAL